MQRRDGMIRLKMFAERTIFENRETTPMQITVVKDEPGSKMIKNVTCNGRKCGLLFFRRMFAIRDPGRAGKRCGYSL
jgi:hypothetical protein